MVYFSISFSTILKKAGNKLEQFSGWGYSITQWYSHSSDLNFTSKCLSTFLSLKSSGICPYCLKEMRKHVQEQEFNQLILTLEWAIHYSEIRKIEPMSSWRWEQFVENHSSNLAFQSQLPEANARRTQQENKLLLHKEVLLRLACEENVFTIIRGFLLQESRVCIFSMFSHYTERDTGI